MSPMWISPRALCTRRHSIPTPTTPTFPTSTTQALPLSLIGAKRHCFLRVCFYDVAGTSTSHVAHCNTLQRPAPHCNTLQHTATHCNESCRPYQSVISSSSHELSRHIPHPPLPHPPSLRRRDRCGWWGLMQAKRSASRTMSLTC